MPWQTKEGDFADDESGGVKVVGADTDDEAAGVKVWGAPPDDESVGVNG